MQQFPSIQKLDTAILYALELASSVSVLLLAFGLIASMANVLTDGAILSDNVIMSRIWSVTQCVAIDASVAGAIIRTYRFFVEKSWLKFGLYALLSLLLLFTAAIVSNIESIQQTLSITLANAYAHVFIPVEGLIWIRSIAIVLLIVCHALRHVQLETPKIEQIAPMQETPIEITLEEQQPKQITAPKGRKSDGLERVKAYLVDHPEAKSKEVSLALSMSLPTAIKWLAKARLL